MNIEKPTWQEFKNTVDSKQLLIQYEESDQYYYLFAVDDPIIYTYRLEKGTDDAVDFEQNYKPYANKRISGEAITYAEKTVNISAIQQVVGQSGKRIRILDELVPENKVWYITGWSTSSQVNGFFELYEYDPSTETYTTIDSMETTTGWVKNIRVISLTTSTDKVEGDYSVKADLKFQDRGLQTDGFIEKTFNPTQDWSGFDEISAWAKSLNGNVKIALQLFQGTSNYLFNSVPVDTDWIKISFDLSEITEFDKTAISKIRICFYEIVDQRKNESIWLDFIQGFTYGNFRLLDCSFVGANIPFVKLFPASLKILGGKRIRIYGTPSTIGNMTASLNAKEV
jgi:hypothetical protein